LFLARTEQIHEKIAFSAIDLTDLVFTLINNYQQIILEKKLKVFFKPPNENIIIPGHPTMIQLLISNLLDNAIKYSFNNKKIWIELNQKYKYAVITVKDQGIGIENKNQEKIFDRFFRADISRAQTKGYGLGLSICKSIINMHRGKLLVKSTLGKGSTFTAYLPLK
jgi:signal transduction histidine kinase